MNAGVRALVLAGALAGLLGCGAITRAPVSPGRSRLSVALAALPKTGVRKPAEGGYTYFGDDADSSFERVNYRRLQDVAVMLSGDGLDEAGPAPRQTRLVAAPGGFYRDLVLMAPNGLTRLLLINRCDHPLTFFCAGDAGDGFDVSVGPGKEAEVTLKRPGAYEILCEEGEHWKATILVAPSTYAALGASGSDVVFDDLPPGRFLVSVAAARLPRWEKTVDLEAGRATALAARLTVENLEPARR